MVGKIQVWSWFFGSDDSYVTSAGFDCGLAIALIAIFVFLSVPKGGINFNWWGNVAVSNTAVTPRQRDLIVGFQWRSPLNYRTKSDFWTFHVVVPFINY